MTSFKHILGAKQSCCLLMVWTILIAQSIVCINALPKPQMVSEDDDDNFATYAATKGAPLITPVSAHIIVEPKSEYILRCEDNEPIVWRSMVHGEFYNITENNPRGRYRATLELSDLIADHVAYYYCVKERALNNQNVDYDQLVEDYLAAKVYVYVDDPEVYLVPMAVPVITAMLYDHLVIPCKPTMPDRVVQLTTPNGDVYSSLEAGRYDPKRGFIVQIQQIHECGNYKCTPQIPSPLNEDEDNEFIVIYDGNNNNDRELAPICDVFPINKNNRKNNINCTVLASEIPLNNNNHTLSSLSPVNNTNFFSQSNNNYNNNNNNININNTSNIFNIIHPDILNVTDLKHNDSVTSRRRATRSFTSSSVRTEATNSIDVAGGGSSSRSSSSLDSVDVIQAESLSKNDRIDSDDDDDSREDFNEDGDDGDDDDNVDVNDSRRRVGVGITRGGGSIGDGYGLSLSSTKFFQFTTESGYGVRMGKRDTTSSHRGRSYKNYGSTPRSKTNHVNRPQIFSQTYGHAVEGDRFELVCTVDVTHGVLFDITWKTPLDNVPESLHRWNATRTTIDKTTDSHSVGKSILTINGTQKSDEGYYKCIVRDRSNNTAQSTYLMTILKTGESYINISEPNNYYTIMTNASKLIQINANYRGYPKPTLTWYAPNDKLIQSSAKYAITQTDASITLKIKDAELTDTGVYILRANNEIVEKDLKFNVYVKSKPQVDIENVYVQAGENVAVQCKTLSYPPAKVVWAYTHCNITPKWPTCERKLVNFNSTRTVATGTSEIEKTYELTFKPTKPGRISCIARNQMGDAPGHALVLMGDLTDNMTVYGVDENSKIAKGDEVIITCAALVYYYSGDLHWYKDGQLVENNDSIELTSTSSDYSYKKSIKFKNIQAQHDGSYECRAKLIESDSETDNKFLNIVVHDPSKPVMSQTNMGDEIRRDLGESLDLICKSTGIPKAGVVWYKDDVKLNSEKDVVIEEDNSVVRIAYIKPEDQGVYKCVASNRLGAVEAISQVKITNMPGLKLGWIFGIIAIIIILLIFVISLGFRIIKDRKTFRQMQLAGLANFEEGALEQINPAMSLDEQADLLPYDRRFEFPKNKLKLGKKLGAGAFGVVLKAYAEGIISEEKETVVAVKMVKRTADNEVIKALVSELKIMVHLGQHLNVVNLLGAVTKDIAKREVMVIVEYCRYGNVQNFLLRNRKHFINQINPMTDKIDPSITQQRYSADFEINRNSENDPRSGTRAGRPNSSGYLRQSDLYEGNVDSCATEQTVMTTIPEGEDNVMSNNSVQPAWRSNYKPDTTETMSVTTSNLVSWGFQVARGMDYLASRKVLHGDLAARNILLCEGNVVKICDFGLARSMYKNDNYKKQGEAPLPIKWLALESLSDQVFSTYTDVWSFGIVLWEFFSLAKVPYPGMAANQSLYLKLKDGYRMEKPPYANDELYDIMLECWSANPESRPLFNELEKKFARLLGDEVTNHYVDLNEPYLRMNTEYLKEKDTDYLALMGSPDEMAPPPPRYVNGMILPEIRIDPSDDYLQMSPKAEQHSPTTTNNLDSPVMKNRKKIGVQPEEIPMLTKSTDGVQRESDSDSDHSPSPQMSARPFAQVNRTPGEIETSLTGSDGNYVNVKPVDLSKKYISTNGIKDGVSNPSYSMLKTVKEGRK